MESPIDCSTFEKPSGAKDILIATGITIEQTSHYYKLIWKSKLAPKKY
jgi:hypothetical protein